MTEPDVLGIDLSLTSTGLAAISGGKLYGVSRITSKGTAGDSWTQRAGRIQSIADEVFEWVYGDGADLVVVEAPSYGSITGAQHDRSGLWWNVVGRLVAVDFPVALVSPNGRAKYATGDGRSDKRKVEAAVRATYEVEWPDRGKCDDIADAVVLAAMGARWLGYPVEEVEPSQKHLDALRNVHWPPRELVAVC